MHYKEHDTLPDFREEDVTPIQNEKTSQRVIVAEPGQIWCNKQDGRLVLCDEITFGAFPEKLKAIVHEIGKNRRTHVGLEEDGSLSRYVYISNNFKDIENMPLNQQGRSMEIPTVERKKKDTRKLFHFRGTVIEEYQISVKAKNIKEAKRIFKKGESGNRVLIRSSELPLEYIGTEESENQ